MIPPKPGSGLYNMLKAQGAEPASHSFWENADAAATPQDDLKRKRAYRITPEQLAALRETAKKFEGSHNFHNFTVGRDFRDRSCQRFLKSIEVRPHSPRLLPGARMLRLSYVMSDFRPCCVRRHRVDRSPVARPELHATSGQCTIWLHLNAMSLTRVQIVSKFTPVI